MAVVALGASAGYTIEKVWELNTSSLVDKSFIRQGFGINGETWYDLNGRRLQSKPSRKGVYIMNGKKVVVK